MARICRRPKATKTTTTGSSWQQQKAKKPGTTMIIAATTTIEWQARAREKERMPNSLAPVGFLFFFVPFFLFCFFFTQYSPSFLPTSLQLAFKSGSESLLRMIGLLYKVFLNNKRKHFLCGLCYNCSEIIVLKFFIILLRQQDNITRMFFTLNIMS